MSEAAVRLSPTADGTVYSDHTLLMLEKYIPPTGDIIAESFSCC